MLPVQKETDFVYENEEGKVCITGLEVAQPLIHQIAFARKNGKWGILNQNCKVIVDFEYDEVSYLSSKGVKLRKGDYYYVLGIENQKLLSGKFEDVDVLTESEDTLVARNEKGFYGLITCAGKQVIPFSYINPPEQIYPNTLVFHKRKGKGIGTGAVSFSGVKKIPFKYFSINRYRENYYKCLRFDGLNDFYTENAQLFFSEGADTLRFITDSYLVYKNANGTVVVNLQSKQKDIVTAVSAFSTGLYGVSEKENKTYVWLADGNSFTVAGKHRASGFYQDVIFLYSEEEESKGNLYRTNGERLLQNNYAGILSWNNKWAVVREKRRDQELFLFDLSTGKRALKDSFPKIELLNGGVVKTYHKNGETTLYNERLKTIRTTALPAESNVVYLIPEQKLRMLNQEFTRYNKEKTIFEIQETNPLTGNENINTTELVRVDLIKDAYGQKPITNRLVATIIDENNNPNRLSGIIDFSGRVVVPFEYAS